MTMTILLPPRRHFYSPSRAFGFSLVEFMVASALGLVLLLGISRVFVAAQVGYGLTQAKSAMQDNSRMAVDTIQRDARMAGFMGCVNDGARFRNNEVFVHLTGAASAQSFSGVSFANNFANAIEGFEAGNTSPGNSTTLTGALTGTWTPALPAQLTGLVANGSDVMVFRYLGGRSASLTGFIADAAGAKVTVDTTQLGPVQAGRVYALTDCNQVSFFVPSSISADGKTFVATGVGGAEFYSTSAAILYETTSVAYYVGNEANGRPGLFRYDLGSPAPPTEAYVPGVVSLQALYGWDTNTPLPDGSVDTFGTASDLASATVNGSPAFARVGELRVSLLLSERGPRRSGTNPNRTMSVSKAILTPSATTGDRLLGVYSTSVALRNHIFGY